jgi:hypothetical protein
MIHLFAWMWSAALITGLALVNAEGFTYSLVGFTAIMYYLMGREDGSK